MKFVISISTLKIFFLFFLFICIFAPKIGNIELLDSNIDYRRENSFFFKPVPRFARKCCKMRLFEFFSNFVHLWKLEKSPKSIKPKILEN